MPGVGFPGMGFRFRRSFKIAPGFHVNVSKTGVSESIGGHGFTVNLRDRRTRATVGVPGTGLTYSTQHTAPEGRSGGSMLAVGVIIGLLIVAIALFA
jgi:hypothetical protein